MVLQIDVILATFPCLYKKILASGLPVNEILFQLKLFIANYKALKGWDVVAEFSYNLDTV